MSKEESIKKIVESALALNNSGAQVKIEVQKTQQGRDFVVKLWNSGLLNLFDILGELTEKYNLSRVDLIITGDAKFPAMLQMVIS